jgi:hypothetical protein
VEPFVHLKLGQVVPSPFVVDVDVEVVAFADDQTCHSSGQLGRTDVCEAKGGSKPFAEKASPAISMSQVVSRPFAFFEQQPRKRLTMSS